MGRILETSRQCHSTVIVASSSTYRLPRSSSEAFATSSRGLACRLPALKSLEKAYRRAGSTPAPALATGRISSARHQFTGTGGHRWSFRESQVSSFVSTTSARSPSRPVFTMAMPGNFATQDFKGDYAARHDKSIPRHVGLNKSLSDLIPASSSVMSDRESTNSAIRSNILSFPNVTKKLFLRDRKPAVVDSEPSTDAASPGLAKLAKPLQPGDLLVFPRKFYDHWAIYLGEQDGIYYAIHIWCADAELSMTDARVCITPMHHIFNWEEMRVHNKWDQRYTPFRREEVLARAVSKLGSGGYNLLINNCEHFVTWARHGSKMSDQVHDNFTPALVFVSMLVGSMCTGLGLGAALCTGAVVARFAARRLLHFVRRRISRHLHKPSITDMLLTAYQPDRIRTLVNCNRLWDGRRKGISEKPPMALVARMMMHNAVCPEPIRPSAHQLDGNINGCGSHSGGSYCPSGGQGTPFYPSFISGLSRQPAEN